MSTPNELADEITALVDERKTTDLALQQAIDGLRNATAAWARSSDAQDARLELIAGQVRALTPTPPPVTARYAGDPGPGKIRMGATYGSNSDPSQQHEASGKPMGCRRTFSPSWSNRNSLLGYAKTDLTVGRYAMLTTKVDVKAMAAGSATLLRELDVFAAELAKLPGPVAFGTFHEPEDNVRNGEFTYAQFRTVQQQVRAALDKAGADNVCHATYPMSWSWNPSSGRNPDELFPGDGVWDALGVDAYQKSTTGVATTEMDEWKRMRSWAQARELPIIVGEWGEKGTTEAALARMRASYEGFLRDGVGAVAWFDTALSGGTDYQLTGARLDVFHDLLADERSVTFK
jgi:hypothetical protein